MTRHLDVLVIESGRGVAAPADRALRVGGHRVHRCFDPGDPGPPCVAARGRASCPLDGGLDVALVVRDVDAEAPTPLEAGVSCALRAGVPVVEQGDPSADPYATWLSGQVDGPEGVVAGCVEAADRALADLQRAVLSRIRPVLGDPSLAARVGCAIERQGHRMVVQLSGPPVAGQVRQALAVRVLDAVWAAPGTVGQVDVDYRALPGAGADRPG